MWDASAAHGVTHVSANYVQGASTQRGITALLAVQRATEQLHVLKEELKIMAGWISSQLTKVDTAIALCSGKLFWMPPVWQYVTDQGYSQMLLYYTS